MTTKNCAECGTRAEPGQSFCDACGAVLSWDPARGTASRATAAAPASAPAGAGAPAATAASADGGTGAGPGRTALGATTGPERPAGPSTPATPAAESAPAPSPATGTETASDEAETVPVPRTGEEEQAPDPGAERARSLLVPVADPQPAPAATPVVTPVLPGRPDAERPQVRGPLYREEPAGGPPCPWCGTANHPDRHFCGHCAMRLADHEEREPGRRPWWRRLFGGRQQETPWAGDRPPLRRVFDRIATWIGAAVALALLVLGVVYIPDGVQATRDHFAKRAPVAPDTIKASRSYSGHKPLLAFDQLSNTWWGPGVSQSGQGEWIEVGFSEPTRLLDVIITPGVSARPEHVRESALPHRVKAKVTLADGKTKTLDMTLDQGAGGQRRPFRVGEVTKVRFTIESAHAASAKKQVAIAEIEFFGPSRGSRF
ncbi:NADase-type glycan-binding domain-containing protein [Streptomyces albidoflavus]|uniref:NADase-type glycan-binding domain-containing protein n=1 Tax=Streptomyces albidoflavus TaxID=1886 RepID=UPI0033F8AA06